MSTTTSHIFSMKPLYSSSSSFSTLASIKLKTLIHTFVFPRLCRVARALTRAKFIILKLLKEIQTIHFFNPLKKIINKKKNNVFLGSFRLHYNWCSSHIVVPQASSPGPHVNQVYYDPTWNSIFASNHDDMVKLGLSGYLEWLETSKADEKDFGASNNPNEIDRLADMFIADCHEKFMLEKQESYRRFQEMMIRSV